MSEYLDPERVPDLTANYARAGCCDGACESHRGITRPVFVTGWGWFSYCEAAIGEDQLRGLKVTVEAGA